MNGEKQAKIGVEIISKEVKESQLLRDLRVRRGSMELLRDLRAVRGEIEALRRKLEK